ITAEQIEELERRADSIDFAAAARREEVCRHEVMAHIYAYGLACPKARGILHLGATSCFVLELYSPVAFLVECGGGQVLLSQRGEEHIYPASLTKIMTVMLG
ncbi:hypothetical protein NE646_14385, partial [Bittarella massiliensis]|nr:hypothetical protein [Bittarella massiliensis (ex Durand et al. 2017)]